MSTTYDTTPHTDAGKRDQAPCVWADGYGVWHAAVPMSGSRQRDAALARRLIIAELELREPPVFDPRAVRITREYVRSHGVAVYGEVTK